MTNILSLLLFFAAISAVGQDELPDTLVVFDHYQVKYSQRFLQPLEISYHVDCSDDATSRGDCKLTWKVIGGVATSKYDLHYRNRKDWERGHMAPAGSFDCDCDMAASTFNYVNCAIQNAELNGGPWFELEKKERCEASQPGSDVSVVIRVEFISTSEINGARIPSGFYKTLIINGKREEYYFPNRNPDFSELSDYRLSRKPLFKKNDSCD